MHRYQKGFSLIELMIAVTVAMVLSIGVLYIYAGQVRTFSQVARKVSTTQEAQSAFEIVASLIRQAEMCLIVGPACPTQRLITITYPAGVANPNAATSLQAVNDSIEIDFWVPSGYAVWPNDIAPYTNNSIRVKWDASTNIVQLSAGAAPGAGTVFDIAGASGKMNTKIVNFDIWPMVVDVLGAVTEGAAVTDKATAGYRLAMTARVGTPDSSYTNPLDPSGSLKNYRTVTYERIILPRNW